MSEAWSPFTDDAPVMPHALSAAPRALAAAQLDAYEMSARITSEIERLIGETALCQAARSYARACADATRDGAAIQLSTLRWVLDL